MLWIVPLNKYTVYGSYQLPTVSTSHSLLFTDFLQSSSLLWARHVSSQNMYTHRICSNVYTMSGGCYYHAIFTLWFLFLCWSSKRLDIMAHLGWSLVRIQIISSSPLVWKLCRYMFLNACDLLTEIFLPKENCTYW